MNIDELLNSAGIKPENAEDLATLSRYLTARNDPSTLVDQQQVREIEASLDRAQPNTVEAILARIALNKAKSPDLGSVKADAVAALRSLSRAGVKSDELKFLGIPDDVIDAATSSGSSKRAATRVTSKEVRDAILGTKEPFTMTSINSGASKATETKVVKRLVEEGKVKSLGPDPDHSGRGRAAELFQTL